MDNNSSLKAIMTLKEFADYSGYKTSYIYQLIYHRKIPVHKPPNGRKLFFVTLEVKEWLLTRRLATMDELRTITLSTIKKK